MQQNQVLDMKLTNKHERFLYVEGRDFSFDLDFITIAFL